MNFIHLPSKLQLLIAEKLESRELSYLSRANHYFHSLCTLVLERLAQEPRNGCYALQWAIINNYPPLVQLLLSKGHDINNLEGSSYSGTALHVAFNSKNYPLILLFLENPTLDLNKLDKHGNTALHLAIARYNLKVVKPLHAAGADLEIVDRQGKTALLLALHCWNVGIMEFLVRNGANVNAQPLATGWGEPYIPFLQGSVWSGSERLVRLALEYGADPEVRDNRHKRAIDIAREWGLTGIVDILRGEVTLPLDVDVESDLETVWSDASSG